MLSFAFLNHFIFGSLKFHSSTLSHFFLHKKLEATSDQKPSGSSTLFLYALLYSSNEEILKEYDMLISCELRVMSYESHKPNKYDEIKKQNPEPFRQQVN